MELVYQFKTSLALALILSNYCSHIFVELRRELLTFIWLLLFDFCRLFKTVKDIALSAFGNIYVYTTDIDVGRAFRMHKALPVIVYLAVILLDFFKQHLALQRVGIVYRLRVQQAYYLTAVFLHFNRL